MGRYFIDLENNAFFNTDINTSIPKNAVEISTINYYKTLKALSEGFDIGIEGGVVTVSERLVTLDSVILHERSWRNSQLELADIELNKVQDSDAKAVSTVAQWREYRKSLRAWPDHKDFPNKDFRPVSPDV